MIERITCSEYAKRRGITKQAAAKAIRKGHKKPYVISVERIGRQYTLTVEFLIK